MQAVCKPLENFFEERIGDLLINIHKCPLLAKTLAMRVELGDIADSDFMDELMRQIVKKWTLDGQSGLLIGHSDVHRVLKDLVKQEAQAGKNEFSQRMARVCMKHLNEVLDSRAIYIVLELVKIDSEETKKLL